MKIVTLLALILTLNACSFSDSNREQVAVHNDDLEFAVDTIADQPAEPEAFQVEEQKVAEAVIPDEYVAGGNEVAYEAPPKMEDAVMIEPVEPKFSDFKKPEEKVEAFLAQKDIQEAPAKIRIEEEVMPSIDTYGPMETYRVQKGDTMMMIAFKIYGDYRKWRDIKSWNKNVKKLGEGVELKYYVPDQKFGWKPNGLPYLVKTGDTLQIVSLDKYGTTRKWKSIYDNNLPLIRNPNLIFAGFTIYYQPARDLASKPK